MYKNYSLQRRLISRALTAVFLTWLATAGYVWFEARHEVDELLDAHLAQSAAVLVVLQNITPEDDEDLLNEPVLSKFADRVAYQVFDDGRLVMASSNVGNTPLSSRLEGFETVTREHGQKWRVYSEAGRDKDARIYVAERIESRDEILRAVLRGFCRHSPLPCLCC